METFPDHAAGGLRPESPVRRDRSIFVVLGVIAVLLVAALVAIFFRGDPEPLDPSTPEGTVQQYATAVFDGDKEAALSFIAADRLKTCEATSPYLPELTRLALLSSDERAQSATVWVTLTVSYGSDPLGSNESQSKESFELVKEDGLWKIDVAPYSLAYCDGWTS